MAVDIFACLALLGGHQMTVLDHQMTVLDDAQCRADISSYDADEMHMMCNIVFHRNHTGFIWHSLFFQL